MRYIKHLVLVLLVIPLCGCPLTSRYPLGNREDALVDSRLFGTWKTIGKEGAEAGYLRIFQFNDREMYLEAQGERDNTISRSRIYVTVVDNVPIINHQEIKHYKVEGDYAYLKYAVADDGTLSLWVLTSNLSTLTKFGQDQLYKYVRENVRNDKLYDKLGDFRKIQAE